jgi:hydrogenase maturation protease
VTTGKAKPRAVVIGVGNEFRRDDGAGPAVVARLRGHRRDDVRLLVSDGEPARLIEAWGGAPLAVVVDAVQAEPAVPGRLHRLVLHEPGAARETAVSSHGLGLDCAIGLARALDRMPGTLILHAVEAADVGQGAGLTAAVAEAIDVLTAAVLHDLDGLGSPPG